ncbi:MULTISPECIES: hypothetical protein [Jannaschia]|nr:MULTISPECIES: hypothetical protein [unclassified Jannaschia]
MMDFLSSLGLFGWAVLALAAIGLISLPRALREMWVRPWSRDKTDGEDKA